MAPASAATVRAIIGQEKNVRGLDPEKCRADVDVNELREIKRLHVEVRRLRMNEAKLGERRHASGRQRVSLAVPQASDSEEDIETQLEQPHDVPNIEHGPAVASWYVPAAQTSRNTRRVSYGRTQRDRLSAFSEADEPSTDECRSVQEPSRVRQPSHRAGSAEDHGEDGTGREYPTRVTMGSSGHPPRRFINVSVNLIPLRPYMMTVCADIRSHCIGCTPLNALLPSR